MNFGCKYMLGQAPHINASSHFYSHPHTLSQDWIKWCCIWSLNKFLKNVKNGKYVWTQLQTHYIRFKLWLCAPSKCTFCKNRTILWESKRHFCLFLDVTSVSHSSKLTAVLRIHVLRVEITKKNQHSFKFWQRMWLMKSKCSLLAGIRPNALHPMRLK